MNNRRPYDFLFIVMLGVAAAFLWAYGGLGQDGFTTQGWVALGLVIVALAHAVAAFLAALLNRSPDPRTLHPSD